MATTEHDQKQREQTQVARKNLAGAERDQQTSSHLAAAGALPSDYEGLQFHTPTGRPVSLTLKEAEEFHGRYGAAGLDSDASLDDKREVEDTILDDIYSSRTVNHQVMAKVPAGSSHPSAPDPDVAPPTVPYVAREDADPYAPNRNDPSSSLVLNHEGELDERESEAAKERAEAAQKAQDAVHEANAEVAGAGSREAQLLNKAEENDFQEPQANATQAGTGEEETDNENTDDQAKE